MATATRAQTEYRAVMDATQNYLHKLNLPVALQARIKLWFTYTWHSQKTLSQSPPSVCCCARSAACSRGLEITPFLILLAISYNI
jgi:hypothetical protein